MTTAITTTAFLENSISVVIKKTEPDRGDEDDEDVYGAFTYINANVFRSNVAIGEISGIAVNRQVIPENCFYQAFDENSASLEWVASALLENKLGRPKLQSLYDAGDDTECDFFLLETFEIDKNQPCACDVATIALRKFLRSKEVKGGNKNSAWFISSVAYVLPVPSECENHPQYHESMPFLRNNFFQDSALARDKNPENVRILVAGMNQLEQNLKPEAEVMPTVAALRQKMNIFNKKQKPEGNDAKILHRVETLVNEIQERNYFLSIDSISSILGGVSQYEPPKDCGTTEEELKSLKQDLANMVVKNGGSIAKSTALHAACTTNSIKVVKLLLQMDPASVQTKNTLGQTPLMVAAINATGRRSINGIDDTQVIDALLASGATKQDVDSVGMTAYGYYRKSSEMAVSMTHYEYRHTITDLEHKLYPPGGPTMVDFAKGMGGSSGFVDYGPEDDERDRDMGEGAYATTSDYEDY